MNDFRNTYQLLKDAYALLNKKKYGDAIVILEKVIAAGGHDPYPLFLLAIAYLFSDKFNKVDEILRRVRAIDAGYIPLHQLEAFLFLKSATSPEAALKRYLDLNDRFPADPYLHRARRMISNTADFVRLQRDARVQDFVHLQKPPRSYRKNRVQIRNRYPLREPGGRPPRRLARFLRLPAGWGRSLRRALLAVAAIGATAVAAWVVIDRGYLPTIPRFDGLKRAAIDTRRIDLVNIAGSEYDLINKVNRQKTPVFYYSAREMVDEFNRARMLIKDGSYNEALALLNRINASNVSFMVREKVDFLVTFVAAVEDRPFERIPFGKVMQSPWLYRGYAVTWRGKVVNLKVRENARMFTLLIDYRDRESLAGLAEVFAEGTRAGLRNGDTVEVDAIIQDVIADRVSLKAREIRK